MAIAIVAAFGITAVAVGLVTIAYVLVSSKFSRCVFMNIAVSSIELSP